MNPIQTKEAIERRLRNYIRKTLPVEGSLPEFTPKVDAFFDANPLLQDAYMEIVPPYEAGASLKTLADEGVVHEQTAQIFANYFAGNSNGNPANFKLHKHQDKAIRQAISQQRNIVVCSGTGSGKTEAFLIPLVDYLVREHAAGSLDSGVRALILYPMNALVNDQIRRLRGVLRYAPHITFGRFIGETPDNHPLSDAFLANARVYEGRFDNAELATGFSSDDDNEVLPNEVTTRKRFLREPAHILVTNYSMLERLLLVPSNSPLFGSKWKFIVLDEAHYYSGALGTEIAWLVRRLRRRLESRGCKPDQLRYFATSATLIDNKELTPAQIAEKVSNEFASRIFPASPESFAVQLGEIATRRRHLGVHQERDYLSLAETPIPDAVVSELCELSTRFPNLLGGGKMADGGLRQTVGGLDLLRLTERVLGAERWAKSLPGGLPVQDGPPGPNCVTAGDFIKVLRKAADSLRSGMVAEIPDQLTSEIFQGTGILGDVSQPSLECLLAFVVDGVGNLINAKDKWRHYLHDDCDPRSSTFQGDDNISPNGATPYRNPIGNRLHLLVEWRQVQNGDVSVLTLDGLEYLVSVASELASIIESEENISFSPASIGIVPSQVVATAMDAFAEQKEELLEVVGKVHALVLALWNTLLGGAVEGTNRIEQRLADWLKDDAKLVELRNHVGTCMADWENADSAKFATVAQSIFPEDAQAQQKLSALVDLATVATPPGQRYPLLDVRHHQLFRGIREAYARPIVGDGGLVDDFEMGASASADYLPLGVCRDCGQPFLLAHSQGHGSPAHNQDLMVSDTKGAGYEYLHAFAWKAGEVFEDDKDDPKQADQNLWLNIVQRKIRHCAHWPGPSWMKVYWHEHPPTAAADKEFLSECPNCRSAQRTRTTRFGIITPYQADGPQLRLVALEELSRATDASVDPSARANPGEGRKVLAFSDSRAGAASLAAGFQTYSLEKHAIRFIEEAAKQISDLQNHGPLLDAILSQRPDLPQRPQGCTDQQWDMLYGAWRQIVIGNVVADLQGLSVAFVRIATENGFLRALELEGAGGAELSPTHAAKVWILEALHKRGRNSIMRRRTLTLDSQRIRAGNLGIAGVSPDTAAGLARKVLDHLVPRVKFGGAILNGSIDEIVNGGLSKKISRNGGLWQIRFVTSAPQSRLNEIVRRAIINEGAGWLAPVKEAIRQVSANNSWVQSFVALEDQPFTKLVEQANDLREEDWIAHLAANAEQLGLPRGNYLTVQRNVRTAVRNFFAQHAETVLDQLWDALTHGGNGLFIPVGNDEFAINCEDLVFLPAAVENHMIAREPEPHEVEEENLATRAVIPLRIEEHTAQINSARGSAYQRGFSKGQINILSCSTTFEMGIDVGDLTCAFLSNLPPGVANYRQRAGRTGRRPGSAAYVLTMIGGSAHDDYFWNHAPELLFGPMSQPVIYLENPLFRARHLRVEALHDFLVWLEDNDGVVPLTKLDKTVDPPNYTRSWKRVGDFFVGCKAVFNFQNQQTEIRGRFAPLTKELPAWREQRRTNLSRYVGGIADVPEFLGYDVADDLLWQLQSQNENQPAISPYSLEEAENLEKFRELGGPKLPSEINGVLVSDTDNPRRMDVETMAKAQFGDIAPNGYADSNQYRLLKEQVVTWVTRNRVAPKYGFPVDVVRLVPNSQDPQGTNVKLERDLKIGLYDYAPDRTVIADKRIYRSVEPICWVASAIGTLLNPEERAVCTQCHEPAWGVDLGQLPAQGCSICGGPLVRIRFVRPDAFQAAPSRPIGRNIPVEKGTPLHVHSGGLRSYQQVPEMNLQTAESRSGTITYINRGPAFRGWQSANGNYSLLHEVRTDVAAWVPSHALYRVGGLLHGWMLQGQGNRNRYNAAMASALHALIRAIALTKRVDARELGGLVYPLQGYNGEAGFIFFDDSSGGGGAVLDLTLLGNNHPRDVARRDLIADILRKAIELCEACPECGGGPFDPVELEKMPISREDYENLQTQQRDGYRVQQSCYKCLRSYQNQRQHRIFDRLDAATLLRQLMPEMGGPELAPALPRIPFDDLAARFPAAGDFDIEGLPGSGHEVDTFTVVGPEDELLIDKHILVLPDGMVVVAWINPNQNPMTYRSAIDRDVGGVLDRTWVRARML
jgi:ATP-dependent helicase YprA (DUF1998 family)